MGAVNTDEFVSAVQQSARIASHEQAEQAVRATLAVLGQRLAGGEGSDLAAQLPAELAEEVPSGTEVEKFGLEEFYRRVAEREGHGCTRAQARQHARAVTTALRETVGGEWLDVLAQLPNDWADLLHTEGVIHH